MSEWSQFQQKRDIEILQDELAASAPGSRILDIVSTAARLTKGKYIESGEPDLSELGLERERIRRAAPVDQAEFDRLMSAAHAVWGYDFTAARAMVVLIHAACVRSCAIVPRMSSTLLLGGMLRTAGDPEAARALYADCVAGIRVYHRFLREPDGSVERVEQRVWTTWEEVRGQQSELPGLFGVSSACSPASEWVELVAFNSDMEPPGADAPESARGGISRFLQTLGFGARPVVAPTWATGLIGQTDASMRLSIHLEHWVDEGGRIDVESMVRECEPLVQRGGAFFERVLLSLGDALLEIREYESAAAVYRRIQARIGLESGNALAFHALAQEAHCLVMYGDLGRCRACLDRAANSDLFSLADSIITMAAAAGRLVAVEVLWRHKSGLDRSPVLSERANKFGQGVYALNSQEPTREGYLRSLFVGVYQRDEVALLTEAGFKVLKR